MRIVVVTKGLSRVYEALLKSSHDIVGVVESESKYEKQGSLMRALLFIKQTFFKSSSLTLKESALKNSIPYLLYNKTKKDSIVTFLKELSPDVMVVYSMSQLLAESAFNIPKYGTVNLHPSFLPEYRGPNPDFWQYYNQVLNPGVTVHYIDSGEDTGDIIVQKRVEVDLGLRSTDRLDILIGKVGVDLLLEALDSLGTEMLLRVPQPVNSPTNRARNIEFAEHDQLIDWEHWSVERVWNLLRGSEDWFKPIEQPKGILAGQNWHVESYEKVDHCRELGKVFSCDGKHYLAALNGRIELKVIFSLKKTVVNLLR